MLYSELSARVRQDGMVQINEFLDWLMGQKSTIKYQQDACGVEFTISNPSDCVDKRFTLTFDKCPLDLPCWSLMSSMNQIQEVVKESTPWEQAQQPPKQ